MKTRIAIAAVLVLIVAYGIPIGTTVAQQPIILTAEGPPNACAGEEFAVTFRFKVDVAQVNGLGSFDIPQPKNTVFVSLEPLAGTEGQIGHSNPDPTIADTHTFSSVTSTEGAVRLVLRTAPDFTGRIEAVAFIRGTGTASSNRVITAVSYCPATLPGAGLGSEDTFSEPWLAVASLAFLYGLISITSACAMWLARRSSRREASGHRAA